MSVHRGPLRAQGFHFIHGHIRPLPELAIEHVDEAVCTADHVRAPHAHATFEIIYVLSGRMRRSAGGRSTMIGPGDFFLNPPRELHSAEADPADPPHIFALAVDPPAAAPQPASRDVDLAAAQAGALIERDPPFERRAIPGGNGAEALFRRLLGELDRLEDAEGRRRAIGLAQVQALIVELFVMVARCSLATAEPVVPATLPPEREDVRRVVTWLETRLSDPPTLAEMAERAGLSLAHFTVVFRRETGSTPLEHLTARRIEAASRALLAPDATVTRVAHAFGFTTSQYFSLVFRKVTGMTPRDWRMRGRR